MSLANSFPNLSSSGFEITSDFSLDDNGIAWAAHQSILSLKHSP